MKMSECFVFDQTFTHIADSGEVTFFNASAIGRWAASVALEPFLIEVNAVHAAFLVDHHGVELAHVGGISESSLNTPLLLAEWGDGTQIMIDGNHRYVRAHQLGLPDMLAWIVKPEQWRPFVVENAPRWLQKHSLADVNASARKARWPSSSISPRPNVPRTLGSTASTRWAR